MKTTDHKNDETAAVLITRCAAGIPPRHIDFLWAGRLARGKHTAFAGEPGDGKSQLSIYVAATISRGGEWPCNEGRVPAGAEMASLRTPLTRATSFPRQVMPMCSG